MQNRITAWMMEHGQHDAPFVLIPTAVNMRAEDADVAQLIYEINEQIDEYGEQPALIVIDTLSKSLGGGDENTSDMATYMDNANMVAEGFECMVNIVHHRGKTTDNKEPRGHSSLKAGLDNVILMEEKGDTVLADITKQKEGETGLLCTFGLKIIDLGLDRDDEMQTSCVIEKTEIRENTSPKIPVSELEIKRRKLTGFKKEVLATICKALEGKGIPIPPDVPKEAVGGLITKVVSRDIVRDMFFASHIATETTETTNRDNLKDNLNRALRGLQQSEIIGHCNGFFWAY